MTLEEDFPRYDGLDDEDEQTEVLRGLDLGAAFAQRYRLEGVIGQGAMGKVFRATDMSLGQSVALKVLHTEKATKPEVVERFRREATVLSELGHPGIVRILDRGNNGEGIDYLVMELIEGTSLQDYVRKRGPLSPEELLPLLVTVCDAVGAAHAKGIIHRDLKPDNLLVYHAEGEARAKVVDFGLSRLRQDASERLTATGTMIGTPRYMAPEQIRSSKDADERTDIYACGVLAF